MKHRKDSLRNRQNTAKRISALKASSVFDDPHYIRVIQDSIPEHERISGMPSTTIIGKNADGILVRVCYGYGLHDSLLILDATVETSAEARAFYEAQFPSAETSSAHTSPEKAT